MIGLAKSADVMNITPIPAPDVSTTQALVPMVEGIPIDMIRFFDVDIRSMDAKTTGQLKDIYKMMADRGGIDVIMSEISSIRNKMGAGGYGETSYGRIWNYLKIGDNIKHLERQRNAMENNYGNESR